jgi:hypothetical protein
MTISSITYPKQEAAVFQLFKNTLDSAQPPKFLPDYIMEFDW